MEFYYIGCLFAKGLFLILVATMAVTLYKLKKKVSSIQHTLKDFKQDQLSWVNTHKHLPPLNTAVLVLALKSKKAEKAVLNANKDGWIIKGAEGDYTLTLWGVAHWKHILV